MIVTCETRSLLAACDIIKPVVSSKATQTVYQSIKVIADADSLTLMGTDLEVGIRHKLSGVAVEKQGPAIISIAKLSAILRECDGSEVRIDADASRTKVTTHDSKYEMPSESPDTFSDIAEMGDDDPSFTVAADVLARMIRRATPAVFNGAGSFAMRSVNWETVDEKLFLVATNGHRLSVNSCEVGKVDPVKCMIPADAMGLIQSAASGAESVRVSIRKNDALFSCGQSTIYSRLTEGRFPPWDKVIPTKMPIKTEIIAGEFLSAIRKACITTDAEAKKIYFDFKPGSIALSSSRTDGSSDVTMKLTGAYVGEPVSLTFDPDTIASMLRLMDGKEVLNLEMKSKNSPVVFRSGDDFIWLAVPLV